MSIFKDFFVKEKPVFTGIARGIGGFGLVVEVVLLLLFLQTQVTIPLIRGDTHILVRFGRVALQTFQFHMQLQHLLSHRQPGVM